MEPFALWVTEQYNNPSLHPAAKHGLGVIVKAVFLQNSQGSLSDLIERSGAQGMYPHNQLGTFEVCVALYQSVYLILTKSEPISRD